MLRFGTWAGLVAMVLSMLWSGAGCGRKVKPGLNVSVRVEGNDRPGERARRILVTFDRSMVNDAQLGKTPAVPPVKLEPPVAGAFRWRENRVLVFEPNAPLPRATRFTVTVLEGTVAPDGFGLAKPFTHSFETERLSLTTTLISDPQLPSPETWAVPDQKVRLSFNLPVAPEAVRTHCRYRSGAGAVALTFVQQPAEAAAPLDWYEVKPEKPLALATAWTFACDPKLSPAEGPLGLATPPQVEPSPSTASETPPTGPPADGRPPLGTYAFTTFGPLKVVSVSPTGNDADPDAAHVIVVLTNPVVLKEGAAPFGLAPSPEQARDVFASFNELLMPVNGLAPRQTFTVTVPAGLQDVFGQTLAEPFTTTFTTGDVQPGFDLETGSWSVESSVGVYRGWARNVPEISVMAAEVPPEKLFALLDALNWWDEQPVDLAALQLKPSLHNLKVQGEANRWNQVSFDPGTLLGVARAPRFIYLAAAAPSLAKKDERARHHEVLLNVTNLGVTSKLAGGTGQVWVTRLSDGQPQPGAEVIVRDRQGRVRWRGRTDGRGLAQTPGLAELLKEDAKPSSKSAPEQTGREESEEDYEDDVDEGGWGWGGRARLLVFAQLNDDVTFVDPEKTGPFAGWSFSVPVDSSHKREALRGFMHTDRGLYRPGETVSMRGLVRKMVLGQGLVPVSGQTVDLRIANPRGEEVFTQKVKLSRYGSWHAEFTTGEDAPLGDYQVTAALPDGAFYERFQVEEFRANTFEVKLQPPAQDLYAGDALGLNAEARYYYGAPVRGADVKFAVHGRSRWVHFDGFEGFSFEDELRHRRDVRPYGLESFWSEEETKLSAEGKGAAPLNLPRHAFTEPTTLLVSATVQDESHQAVTAHLSVPVHPARFYLGVDTGGWMAPASQPKALRFVAVSAKGQPLATKANLVITRHKWSCAFEAWGYRGSYRCTEEKQDLVSERLSLTKENPTTITFTPPAPGEYWVKVEGFDRHGTRVQAASSLWVWGDGESAWSVDESGRFELVADKETYAAGETARLLPKAPLAGATALVTIEREGVLETRVLSDLQDGQAIEVPVGKGFAPNAFVSVLLSRGRTQPGSRGLPKMTMGLVNLPVSHDERRLALTLNTDKASYRPGDTVNATIKLQDAQGRPVQGEVAIAAADEGVLSLINFATPDPMKRFYAPWGLGVMTASQLERLAQVPEPGQDRYVTGGDAAGAPGTFRARFRATAYWNPGVETNAQGEARVSFLAPDNLTAFRLMGVAADAGDRFGHGDQRFTVNKPLQLLSALPRFASVGDVFDAAVIVMNETGQAGSARVTFDAEGLLVEGPRERTVALPVGGRKRVAFSVKVTEPGQARVRFAARMGEETDGLEQSFPLQHPTSEERTMVSAGSATAETRLAVSLPEGTLPGTATLELSLDPDGLAGIEEGLRDLIAYPYGCLEQTTSRLIPLVAVEELARALALPDLEGPRLSRYIRFGVEKIGRHQTSDGGFSLWPGGESEPYLSAFALWGLKLAKDAGHPVNDTRIEEGLAYLRRSLEQTQPTSGPHYEMGELGSRAFTLYVLELYGRGEAGTAANLYERRKDLPIYGLAFLARALAGGVGVQHRQVEELVAELEALVPAGSEAPLVKERTDLRWYMSSDARTTAIVTDTLLALHPAAEEVPALVRGLMKASRGGAFENTQENLYALVALTNYAKANAGQPARVVVRLGDKEVATADLGARGASRIHHVSLPVTAGASPPLVVAPTLGRVFYQARLRYRRDPRHQTAVTEGFVLERAYLDPSSGEPLSELTAGDMVRVRLSFETDEPRTHVALTDWLPAGLEPMNARFATSADAKEDTSDWRTRLWSGHREMHDERVSTFSDWVYRSGRFTVEYLARATTSGTFVLPSATIEEMYTPEVRGRVALGQLRVLPQKE